MTPIGYTRDELFGLRHRDVTPARSLRKTIFRHRLWQPAYDRKQTWWKIQRQQHIKSKVCYLADRENAPPPEPKRQQRLLTPSAVKLGLLNAQSVGNSSEAIATIVNEGEYDVFMLTETWHSTHEDVALRRCIPPGFTYIDVPRPTTRVDRTNHGGVAAIISEALHYKVLPPPFSPTTFESVAFTVGSHEATVAILLIYRPGSEAATDAFFTELAAYLEVFALYKCHILVAGDFNIHVERAEATDTVRLHNLLESCDCIQQVPFTPTHRDGGTLDLVITKSEQILEKITVNPPGVISDHSVISWQCPLDIQPTAIMKREVTGWTKLDQEGFRTALLTSELCSTEQ